MNEQASLTRGKAARGEMLRVAVLGGGGAMGGMFGGSLRRPDTT